LQTLDESKSALILAMGVDESKFNQIAVEKEMLLPELKLTLDEIQLLAMNQAPEIILAEYSEMISKRNVQIAKDSRHPNLNVFSSLGYTNDVVTDSSVPIGDRFTSDKWYPSFAVGLNSSMPLYTGGSIPANIDKAKATYKKSRYEKNDIVLKIKKESKQIFNNLQYIKKRIDITRKQIINSKANLRIVERNYESGLSVANDVFNSTEELYKTELSFLQLQIEYNLQLSLLANTIGVEEEVLWQK
jgi:outer membrane protein TolC